MSRGRGKGSELIVKTNGFDGLLLWEYIGSMKVKTSITLSEDLLKTIDKQFGQYKNRSDFIETAVRSFIAQKFREARNAKDLEIINRKADYLNREATDVLAYQGML